MRRILCTCLFNLSRLRHFKYTGLKGGYGDEGCLPCRRPPPGYYIRVSGKHPAVFYLCMTNCTALFRRQQTPCGDFTDAVCGSCFAGYHDETNNVNLACTKMIRSTTTTVKSTLATTLKETGQRSNDSVITFDARTGAFADDKDFLSTTQLIVGLSCGGVSAAGCLAGVLLVCWKKRPQRKCEVIRAKEKRSELEQGLLADNHSECHTGLNNDERCSSPIQSTEAVYNQNESKEAMEEHSRSIQIVSRNHNADNHTDLTMDGDKRPTRTDPCRPELSMQSVFVTDCHNALPSYINHPLSRSTECTICKCRERRQCACKRLSKQYTNIKMLDLMGVIDIVARHICHDPKGFFQSLEVLNSKYYQTFVSIDRWELRAECYREMLKEWVHIKGDQAYVSDLIGALCEHNFHDICDVIANNFPDETHLKYKVYTETGLV
ncbi:uncharacterized protein LOC127876094 isoform X2 [Dreissena polymorpha]|uniref:uncharacterized protein LOC127876094 isoform X2 n=1 Tax=Dreissena polymorpha TaxID=45954 RepID=UPI0022644CED|nr:uncharacterized protein LOC127876094 isoform X2 [Dreissena polymorpha]